MAALDLVSGGMPLRLRDKALLERFYRLEYDGLNPPLYLAEPLHAELEGKTNIRYMVVPCGMDEALVVYKVTKIMGGVFVHVFDKPISAMGDPSTEEAVVGMLRSSGAVFLCAERHAGLYRNVVRKDTYDNYWYDLDRDNAERFSNGRWRRKSRARLFLEDGSGYRIVRTPSFGDIAGPALECRRRWWAMKGAGKVDTGMRFIERTAAYTSGEFMHFALFRGDACLAFQTELVNAPLGYSTALYLSRVPPDMAPAGCDRRLVSNLDDCIRYASGTWLLERGIRRQYALGFGIGRNSLRRHKEATCSGKIAYYIGE